MLNTMFPWLQTRLFYFLRCIRPPGSLSPPVNTRWCPHYALSHTQPRCGLAGWISFTQQLVYYREGAHLPAPLTQSLDRDYFRQFRSSVLTSTASKTVSFFFCILETKLSSASLTLTVHCVQYALLLPVPWVTCWVPQGSIPGLSVFPAEGSQTPSGSPLEVSVAITRLMKHAVYHKKWVYDYDHIIQTHSQH